MEEKVGVTLDQRQFLELEAIIIDRDREAAFKFLEENIYRPIKKSKEAHCKPLF